MPHGVTGDNVVDCYVTDESNRMYYLQNMMVICHELSHMILKLYYPDSRGMLDHDDTWGKAGDVRNYFTAWHEREYYFYGIDIDDITNKRNLNNGI